MTYWKGGLFFINWWSSCGILHHIVDECSDVSEEHTASFFRVVVVHMDAEVEATHSSIVLEHSFSTQQKPKRRLSADWLMLWKLQNFYQNLSFVLVMDFENL